MGQRSVKPSRKCFVAAPSATGDELAPVLDVVAAHFALLAEPTRLDAPSPLTGERLEYARHA